MWKDNLRIPLDVNQLISFTFQAFGNMNFINQIDRLREDVKVTPVDLLQMPAGMCVCVPSILNHYELQYGFCPSF